MQQVVTVPTAEQELHYINQRVAVTAVPRGKLCIRKRSGAMKKYSPDTATLWTWMFHHVPDWRDTLALM